MIIDGKLLLYQVACEIRYMIFDNFLLFRKINECGFWFFFCVENVTKIICVISSHLGWGNFIKNTASCTNSSFVEVLSRWGSLIESQIQNSLAWLFSKKFWFKWHFYISWLLATFDPFNWNRVFPLCLIASEIWETYWGVNLSSLKNITWSPN